MQRAKVSLGFMGHLSIIAACVDENVDVTSLIGTARQQEWMRFRVYLEQKHFLECEYRHGGSIPLPENFQNPLIFSGDASVENSNNHSSHNQSSYLDVDVEQYCES